MSSFVHLHLHTEYSLVDGIVRIPELVRAAAKAGMPAVAVTEDRNLFSMVKFYRTAMSVGVKPVVGVDIAINNPGDITQPFRMVLLCQNFDGYVSLSELVSRMYLEGQTRQGPLLDPAWLAGCTDNLIALCGSANGNIGQALLAGRNDVAERHLDSWRALFPDRFYLELRRTGREADDMHVDAAVELAIRTSVPVVATNDVRFIERGDFEAHEARVCIHGGRTLADPRRPKHYTDAQHLRSPEDMAELFGDLPEALENSVEIAKRCNLQISLGDSHLPDFPVSDGTTLDETFRGQAKRGLDARISRLKEAHGADIQVSTYEDRLNLELEVITGMGYPGYFLIVADFVRWAREHDIPVGPGRGSGAGSLVAYALGITDLDPIKYDLLFERFLNPERVSLPDFDIDFCMEGRDRVIDYVTERYRGEDAADERVSQIITFGTMAAKAVVRDVGRVLGHPYGYVDQLAKLIPFELGITLDKALQEDALKVRYDNEEEVRLLFDLARKLEGLARNAGRHAGGVVIAPKRLTHFTPLYCEQDSNALVTQFDKDDVESIGLVKFDFLGLRTLTIIDRAVKTINERRRQIGEADLDINVLETDDEQTYELVRTGKTTAVFQLESRGIKDLIRRLQPDCFDDLVALVALFRPGPLQSGMVDDFIDRKRGRAPVSYPHPEIEGILKPTYGVILYQEQVMQNAQVLAGYTLGGADILRRAMGKKKPEEMAKQRQVFLDGATNRGVNEATASHIFDLMEKFAGYGFNKSHSVAYALLSYQTAWLKTHYPAPFMAAVLSADIDNTDKVVTLIDECRDLKITVRSPDVNSCMRLFAAEDESTILYGLGAIKGVGESAVESVLDERVSGGPFKDLFDFCIRVDRTKVNRRLLEALIRAGALDGLGPARASMMATVTLAMHVADQHCRDSSAGQDDMFGEALAPVTGDNAFAAAPDWSDEERLAGEKQTLGLYLSGHPITRFEAELDHLTTGRLADVRPGGAKIVTVAGLLVSMRTLNSRRGRMAVMTLDDRSGRIEAVVYSEVFQRYRELLGKDRLLILEGEVSSDDFTGGYSITVEKVFDINGVRAARARSVLIRLGADVTGNGMVGQIANVLKPYCAGSTPVLIDYRRSDSAAKIKLGNEWKVNPTDELLARLREVAGEDHVTVQY